MPKSSDKTKGTRKRKNIPSNSNAGSESDGSTKITSKKKKKVHKTSTSTLGIEMSKQLAAEVQKKRTVRLRGSCKKNNEPRLLGNGNPMPSLAELEAMYTDSDEEEDPSKLSNTSSDRCSPPILKPISNDINLDSPETLQKITSKVIDILTKKVIELEDDCPPPPVIPQKKPKKSDVPYIVGCKERPQVPWAPKTKFCVGSEDYGIGENQAPDEEPSKRKKRGVKINLSKSIFNAKSDEIAERLKELDTIELIKTGSPDSNKTIEYDCPVVSPTTIRAFSPLPSTSRDSEIIEKNDKLFNESLYSENLPTGELRNENDSQTSIEIIESPYETVVIDDSFTNNSTKTGKRHHIDVDDDSCILVEPEVKRERWSDSTVKAGSSPKDDIYGSIDLTQTYSYDTEIYEINDDDIDSLLAESKVILEKDLKKKSIDTITHVDSNVIDIDLEDLNVQTSASSSNKTNSGIISKPTDIECVQLETPLNTDNNQPSTQSSQNNQDIVDVVTNFFSAPQNTHSSSTVNDVTNSGKTDTMLSKISSWINCIESFFSKGENFNWNSRSSNPCKPCLCTPHSSTTCCSHGKLRHPRSSNAHAQAHVSREPIIDLSICLSHSNSPSKTQASNCVNSRKSMQTTSVRTHCLCPPHSNTTCCSHRKSRHPQSLNAHAPTHVSQTTSVVVANSHNIQSGTNTPLPTCMPQEQPLASSPPSRSLGDCPICMDNLTNGAVASTMCGHIFCMPCIKAAIKANGKRCPTCRKTLKGVGYHQLFI